LNEKNDDMHSESHAGDAPAVGHPTPRLRPVGVTTPARSRHSQHRSTRRALRAALLVTLGVLALVLVLGWVYTTALRARIENTTTLLARQDARVAELERELVDLRAQRDAFASGRLPGLVPIEYDRAFPIERQYVRNVIFTAAGTRADHRYEYRIVLANGGAAALHPAVRLLFFDDRGIQVGESDVARDAVGAPTGLEALLQPGETRGYTAVMTLERDATPHYFLVVVE
jgi:hypothetical protein